MDNQTRSLWIIEAPGKIKCVSHALEALGYHDATVIATGGHFKKMPPTLMASGISTDFEDFLRVPKPYAMEKLMAGIAAMGNDGQIYIATDADTEGHVIATDIVDAIRHLPLKMPLRVLLRALDKDSIENAIADAAPVLREDATAGRTRAIIDRLIGAGLFAFNRGHGLGAGRIKAAILGIVAYDPPPLEYFSLVAPPLAGGRDWHVRHAVSGPFDPVQVARLVEMKLPPLKEASRTDARPMPDDMGRALIRGGDEINLSPKEAAIAMQSAYESGLLSYPRSDARGLSRDAASRLAVAFQQTGQRFDKALIPDRLSSDVHDSPWPVGAASPSNHPQSLGPIEGMRAILARNLLRSGQRCIEGRHLPGALYAFLIENGFSEDFSKAVDALPWARDIGPRQHGAPAKSATYSRRADTALLESCVRAGIGRPSTYAEHIDNLLSRGFVDDRLRLTESGQALLEGTPAIMLSPEFSRDIEAACKVKPQMHDLGLRYEAWQVRAMEMADDMPEPIKSMIFAVLTSPQKTQSASMDGGVFSQGLQNRRHA